METTDALTSDGPLLGPASDVTRGGVSIGRLGCLTGVESMNSLIPSLIMVSSDDDGPDDGPHLATDGVLDVFGFILKSKVNSEEILEGVVENYIRYHVRQYNCC